MGENPFTFDAEDAEEEHTTLDRNVAPRAATASPQRSEDIRGKRKHSTETGHADSVLDLLRQLEKSLVQSHKD
jgi:hypothetical protein